MKEEEMNRPLNVGSCKKIPLGDDMLGTVAGGKLNVDENGQFIRDLAKCTEWINRARSKTYHDICPICKRHMYECTWNYPSNETMWYMFWYNRLYCTTENKWHDNELD